MEIFKAIITIILVVAGVYTAAALVIALMVIAMLKTLEIFV